MATPQNGTAAPKPAPTAMIKRDQGFEPETLNEAIALAERLATSALLPDALKGKPNDVLIMMLQGRELGLSPVRSLNDIYVVKGKPMCSADTMKALCLRHPDICEYFYCVEATDKAVTMATKRAGSPKEERETFSIEDAQKGGLTSNDLYIKRPRVMLEHRATTILARRVYPDLVRGFYSEDELEDVDRGDVRGGAGNFTAPAEPKTVESKRMDTPAPAPTPPPQAAPAEPQKPGEPTAEDKRIAEALELVTAVQSMEGFQDIGDRVASLTEGASDAAKESVRRAWNERREQLRKGV